MESLLDSNQKNYILFSLALSALRVLCNSSQGLRIGRRGGGSLLLGVGLNCPKDFLIDGVAFKKRLLIKWDCL